MIGMEFDSSALMAKLDALNEKVQTTVVRAATQAATQEVYDMVKTLTPESKVEHYFYGQYSVYGPGAVVVGKKGQKLSGAKFQPGTLHDSIYQAFSKDNSPRGIATYHIAWNHKKCPYGHMVEYGINKKQGHSFLRRGYEYTKRQAMIEAHRKIAELLNVS